MYKLRRYCHSDQLPWEICMEGETFLWLIRHAPVDGIKGTIHAADAPADLTDRAQLEALRRHLPRDVASYASPSRRTVETARALGLEPALVSEFSEQNFGDWTGRRHDELAATGGEAYAQFWSDPARGKPPGGESFDDQVARVRRGLSQIGPGSATLVVHSGTIRAALCVALDLTPQAALRFVVDPLSLTRIDRLSNGWRVVSVNQRIS
jgi:alpha-ribazole phosphatase